jgi:hypothetical protein
MNSFTICPACKIDYSTCSNLNKHLTKCEEYDTFIKTYKPPEGIKCAYCNLIFVHKQYLDEHNKKCK